MITPWFTEDVERRVAETMTSHREALISDLEALAGSALPALVPGERRTRLATRLIDLIVATLQGGVSSEDAAIAEVVHLSEGALGWHDVFTLVRLAGRCAESEMALDPQIGATSEHWPAVVERLQRSSFDLLASYCSRQSSPQAGETGQAPIADEVFALALDKELQRAVRYHRPVAVILFEVDGIAEIETGHGRGVADLVLERVGVFTHQYFRQIDWVGRQGRNSVAVLLPETGGDEAAQLAEGARDAIAQRLAFPDRNDRLVAVTVSGTVVAVSVGRSDRAADAPLDAAFVLAEAESALRRAKACGGNRIERVELARPSWSVNEAAAHLRCATTTIRRLIAAGTLPAINAGGHARVDRLAVEAYAKRTGKGRLR